MPDRYEELKSEILHLLDSHHVSNADREKLHRLAGTAEWDNEYDWAYATGVVSSVLGVIDTASREALAGSALGSTVRDDLKALLEQHTRPG